MAVRVRTPRSLGSSFSCLSFVDLADYVEAGAHREHRPPPTSDASVDGSLAPLLNLLAVIHRDGGHHTDAVGTERSCLDAEKRLLSERLDIISRSDAGAPRSVG